MLAQAAVGALGLTIGTLFVLWLVVLWRLGAF